MQLTASLLAPTFLQLQYSVRPAGFVKQSGGSTNSDSEDLAFAVLQYPYVQTLCDHS